MDRFLEYQLLTLEFKQLGQYFRVMKIDVLVSPPESVSPEPTLFYLTRACLTLVCIT